MLSVVESVCALNNGSGGERKRKKEEDFLARFSFFLFWENRSDARTEEEERKRWLQLRAHLFSARNSGDTDVCLLSPDKQEESNILRSVVA